MALLREKTILLTASGISLAAILFVGIISHHRSVIEADLARWGFDRTVVISADSDQADPSGTDAKSLIASESSVAEGPRAVLSSDSLARLAHIPSVTSILAVSKTNANLQLPGGISADVSVFNVPPEFVTLFGLGDPKLLRQGDYIPSARLLEQLPEMKNAGAATIGVPNDIVEAMPLHMRENIDWSKAKYAVRIPGAAYDLPRGARIFDDALFTTGREPKFTIPGAFMFPSIKLFVRIRDGGDLSSALESMKQFVGTAQASRAKTTLSIALLSDFFAEELGLTVLADWERRLLFALSGVSALLLTMLAFTLLARMRHECALRLAMGATARRAVWLSIRPVVSAISLGLAAGCAVGMMLILAASRVHPASLIPVTACLIAIAMAASLVLIGMTGYGARNNLLAQLNT